MDVLQGGVKALSWTADATTSAAGAVGGAAVNGIVGGMQGAVNGVKSGLSTGSRSTPAAALTLGAIGAAGIVDWPVLLGIGGTALVIRRLTQRPGQHAAPSSGAGTEPEERQTPDGRRHTGDAAAHAKSTRKAPARKSTARKAPQRKPQARKSTSRSRQAPSKA